MKSSFEKIEANKVLLTVEVPSEDLDEAIELAYGKIAKELDIPGFRKGKAPKAIIDSRVGASTVDQEAIRDALPNYYIKAIQESGIEPVDVPSVDIKQGERGKPLIFTAEVLVKPEPKLGEYTGINIEQLKTEVKDEEVEKNIDSIRERFAILEELGENRPIENGDFVVIDFTGYIDGKAFDGGEMQDYTLLIGSGSFIDSFEDQLVGKNKGDEVKVEVVFPNEYQVVDLAGKPATFDVQIKDIKVKKLPDMTDELAKEASSTESAEELRGNIRSSLERMYSLEAENDMKARLLKKITEVSEVDIPEPMIEDEVERQVQEFARMLGNQGVDMDKYAEVTGKTIDELKVDFKGDAEKSVKVKLVLEAIGKAEGIEVTEADIDEEMELYAEQAQESAEQLKERILHAGNMGLIVENIMRTKTIEWLAERANIDLVEKLTPAEEPSSQENTRDATSTEPKKQNEQEIEEESNESE